MLRESHGVHAEFREALRRLTTACSDEMAVIGQLSPSSSSRKPSSNSSSLLRASCSSGPIASRTTGRRNSRADFIEARFPGGVGLAHGLRSEQHFVRRSRSGPC
jgi:hypothetical protein